MFVNNKKISLRQLQALLLLQCFGTAVLFLPAELAVQSGRECWIVALLGGGVFAGVSLLLSMLSEQNGDIVRWCKGIFGNIAGTAVLLGLAGKFLFDGACELRIFSEVVCRSMLPNTPVWVLSPVLLLLCGFLAGKGIEAYGRLAEILFFFTVIPLGLLLLAVAVTAEYQRLLPLELPSVRGLVSGVGAVSVVFQGLPFLYFLFPYLKKPKQAKRAVLGSTALLGAVVTGIVLLSLAAFGAVPLSEKLLPTLQLFERVSFTGIFLTRQDVVFLWFWMCSAVVFVSGVLLAVVYLAVRLFPQIRDKRKQWLWSVAVLLWVVSFLPENLTMAYRLRMEIAPWLQLLYLGILPFGLLLLRKGGKRDA